MKTSRRPATARLGAALCLVLLAALAAAAPAAATAARALVDIDLQDETEAQQATHVAEIADHLRARYLRLSVEWNRAEPQKGAYDEAYLASIEHVLDLAAAGGVRVVLTLVGTPQWASDTSLWDEPPSTYPEGRYYPFYAPRASAVEDFGAFAGMLASRFKGRVFAYECWNEPNLWLFFCPQVRDGVDDFAARRYTQLLGALYAAVNDSAADPDALVIGGATAPVGEQETSAERTRTSPQLFARQLKELGAFAVMDAYSHHPYQPGPAPLAPEEAPRSPEKTVTLQNLPTLLDIVPDKPFYLTEYGYNTAPSTMFGVLAGQQLSQAKQADYLRRAYRYAGRYTRVKALFWYLRKDSSPSGKASDSNGVYTGLRTVSSSRKRSWYVFAGGMKLTLAARSPIAPGAYTSLTGALTCSRLATATSAGGVSAKTLEVQRKVDGVWKTVKTTKTKSGGRYTAWVRLSRSSRLRVRWQGVVVSAVKFVAVR
jgi:hypothetical protein